MMRQFAILLVFAMFLDEPQPSMKLEGLANWGDLTMLGKTQFRLDNHPVWFGVGRIRDDGKIILIWTLRATDEPCPGVYTVNEKGELVGEWGYAHDTKIEDDGRITGNVRSDRVYLLPPLEPDL